VLKDFTMATTKVRSNVYLDKQLKEEVRSIFKEYGLSLSDGINMLLGRVVKNKEQIFPKELNIEPIYKDDPDYEIIKNAKKHYKEHSEDYVDFNDIKWD